MVWQLREEQIETNRKVNDLNKRIAQLAAQQRAFMNSEQNKRQRDTPVVIENDK
jgi:hypothetical protein